MPILVGSVDVRTLTDAGIDARDVQESVRRWFGSDLRIRHDTHENTISFLIADEDAPRWRVADAVQVLTISGKHSAYSVALRLPLSQYTAQTKVVPTSSKKLLLI